MKALRPVILILTTHTGGGHLNLAQSLKDMLGTDYEITIINPRCSMVELWYTGASRHFLKFFDCQYILTDNETASLWLHFILTRFDLSRLLGIIEHVQPQLIITTHSMLSYATARANERLRK